MLRRFKYAKEKRKKKKERKEKRQASANRFFFLCILRIYLLRTYLFICKRDFLFYFALCFKLLFCFAYCTKIAIISPPPQKKNFPP